MRHEPGDVVDASTPARSSVSVRRVDDGAHRAPEHFLALHLHVVPALGDGLGRRRACGCRRPGSRGAPAAEPSQPRSHASSPARRRRAARAPPRRRRRRRGSTVPRSSGSVMRLSVSAPTMQHVLVAGAAPSTRRRRARRRSPRTRRSRSNEPQRSPSASPTNAPVWGSGCSGDAVATISRSMSVGREPGALDRVGRGRGRRASPSSRPGPRCGARGCRCARRSTRRWCRRVLRGRRS